MIGRTYSKRPSTSGKSTGTPTKKAAIKEDPFDFVDACHVKDVDELVGMGAVSMLADDIHFAVDSVDPRHNATTDKVLSNLRKIRKQIAASSEYGRQFRAHHGLDRIFEWWATEGTVGAVRGELLWMFCHLGAKVRRVDHFVNLQWIFDTSKILLSGDGASLCSLEDVKSCEPFLNQPVTYSSIAQYMIGKACLCKTNDNLTIISNGLLSILEYLNTRDQQTITLLDFAVNLNVEGAHQRIIELLKQPPFKAYELKALVSVTGSPDGWLWCAKDQIKYILETIKSMVSDCEWCIYALSVLINCVDRDQQSNQYDWVVEGNHKLLLEIENLVPEEAKPYASLLLAFAIMNMKPKDIHSPIPQTTLENIRSAIRTFITIPDQKSAMSVKQLADRLKQNDWLPDDPK